MNVPPEDIKTEELTPSESIAVKEEKAEMKEIIIPANMPGDIRRKYLQVMVKALPTTIQNRLVVLKNLQIDQLKIQADYADEVLKLEKEYQIKYQPLYEKRRDIVAGKVDPPLEAPMWKQDDDDDDDSKQDFDYSKLLNEMTDFNEEEIGIPQFWCTVFNNTQVIADIIYDDDIPLLKKLSNVTVRYDDVYTYTIEFHFDQNEYFTNGILTKQYILKPAVDENKPFNYEGPEIVDCVGCNIEWKEGKNLTLEISEVNKTTGDGDGLNHDNVKQVRKASFFNFFSPPIISEDQELNEETKKKLASDYEVGYYLRSQVIPKAILYYTGDVMDDDDESEDEGDEEEETGEEEQEDSVEILPLAPRDCALN